MLSRLKLAKQRAYKLDYLHLAKCIKMLTKRKINKNIFLGVSLCDSANKKSGV